MRGQGLGFMVQVGVQILGFRVWFFMGLGFRSGFRSVRYGKPLAPLPRTALDMAKIRGYQYKGIPYPKIVQNP